MKYALIVLLLALAASSPPVPLPDCLMGANGCLQFVSRPTPAHDYAALRAFILADKGNEHEYIADVYDCTEFSEALVANLRAAGFSAWVASVTTDGGLNHDFAMALTSDRGIVWVESQDDGEYQPSALGQELCRSDGLKFCFGKITFLEVWP